MAAQLSIDVSEKADMCKFMEEKKLAMSMDTESQINILEENLKRMEKIHQKKSFGQSCPQSSLFL